MECARTAQPAWAALKIKERCAYLGRLRREIARQCDSISALIARETRKPLLDALAGDVLVTLEQIRYYEHHAANILQSRRNGKPLILFHGARFETHFEPHGVALVCGPSNYPFQLSVIPTITALAAGNAVILKCSERAPETAALIAELCARVNFPQNLVQVIHGGPDEAEALLDARPNFVFFTGSSHHGQMVAQRAARHLIPTVLELGGKDASLVFEDCLLDRAVEGIAYGAFSNSGRVCVAVKRVYVHESIFETFVAKLKARIAVIRVANEPDSDLFPLSSVALSMHLEQVRDALSRGATQCFPADDTTGGGPVLLTDVPAEARILTEESFGPALIVQPFRDEAEAIALANSSPFALSSSVWTRDGARARRVAARMSAGSCAVNDVIRVIANPYASFGGNGKSGYGRYHGPEGLRSFSRIKTVMHTKDRSASQINWFPFTGRTSKQLIQLIRLRHGAGDLLARMSRVLLLAALAALLCVQSAAQAPHTTRLSVDVQLTGDAHGELAYLVFASASGFPGERDKALLHGFLPIQPHTERIKFDVDVPPGTYAVTVYEDLNGNHKLDHNSIGIPSEPVGASNNPKGRFGPPRFSECAFSLGNSPQTIAINIVKGL
jgi:4,4'-diapolycopenoate synthase